MTSGLLKEYDLETLMRTRYHQVDLVVADMAKAIRIYWNGRKHPIARSRIKSAVRIIRECTGSIR